MQITKIGLDIAKNIFFIHGVDRHGKQFLKKKLKRDQILNGFSNLRNSVSYLGKTRS